MRIIKRQTAQTALELAVFGAILIFMLGVIVKSSVNRNFQQHSILRATRWAMTQSNITTGTTVSGRNFASVLVIEDRLSAASGKYGALDRVPSIVQGSGTHSVNLFMPISFPQNPATFLDHEDLRRMDVFVNGLHFDFTTEGFRRVELARRCAGASPCPAECGGACNSDYSYMDTNADPPHLVEVLGSIQTYPGADIVDPATQWEPNCAGGTTDTLTYVSCAGLSPCPIECSVSGIFDCGPASTRYYVQIVSTPISVGCAKLYTIVDNHQWFRDKGQWCDDGTGFGSTACPPTCVSGGPILGPPPCNLSAADRFDLDRDGFSDVPAADRQYFSWQWRLIMGYDEAWIRAFSIYGSENLPNISLLMAEGIILEDGWCEKKCKKAKNTSFDVDRDLKTESMFQNTEENEFTKVVAPGGVILSLGMQDSHLGDIDLSYNTSDRLAGKPAPGLTKDTRMYSFVHDAGPKGGTYYQIEEGQLFLGSGDTRQFIRNASKKDQIDYIERVFQLSNNTGRFCSAAGVRNPRADNPVDVCGASPGVCFSSANIEKVCMDTINNRIFIRSRVEDLHGRKWVTDVSSDPSINFSPVPLNAIFRTRILR